MQIKVRVNIFVETLDFRKICVIIVVIDETKRQVLASSLAFQADLSEFDSFSRCQTTQKMKGTHRGWSFFAYSGLEIVVESIAQYKTSVQDDVVGEGHRLKPTYVFN